ncbi:hypothetical protein ikelab_00620 [Lactococcus garvieae]|uniref:Uncharacterized protein n=1 Tax=Lactococcus garvieae TaxID=1363 RepID=A0A6L2ZTN9_9LACT|nr:hypothetical protein [Lactococcus garvieae]GFO50787.1 hypothetical protein ikelab_00620 [Lactococcus garvieae]
MLNLFENYREEEKDLENSLKQAGYEQQTIVLNEDGYLPEHVTSPISFFTGMKEENSSKMSLPSFLMKFPSLIIGKSREMGKKLKFLKVIKKEDTLIIVKEKQTIVR